MLNISQRAVNMPESPIRKLAAYAQRAKTKGIKIYHLNIGQPDIKTPQRTLQAVKDLNAPLLPYTQSQGLPSLQQAFVKYYKRYGIEVEADDVLVTSGASEAIFFLMNTIADPGDEVIIPEPFYANYLGFATASEIKIKPLIASFEDNFALPSIEAFERSITPKTKAILICNPGNPTGYLCSKEEILQLAALAKKYKLYLIADEVYREFIYDGEPHYSIMEIPDFSDYAVMIDSVSKRYSMCGARIGCLVSKNRSIMAHVLKFAQARLSPPYYGQIAAETALQSSDDFYEEVVREYKTRRDALISALLKVPGLKVSTPRGAFYCMVELPVKDVDHFAQWLLESFSYENQTVMIAPASGFYIDPRDGNQMARLAYVLCKEDLEKAAFILKKALEAYPGESL